MCYAKRCIASRPFSIGAKRHTQNMRICPLSTYNKFETTLNDGKKDKCSASFCPKVGTFFVVQKVNILLN